MTHAKDRALNGASHRHREGIRRAHFPRQWQRSPRRSLVARFALSWRQLARTITRLPEGFAADPKIALFLKNRLDSIEDDSGFNMATAESIALASLLHEGTPVRLSGQDSVRGTFTQRHLGVHGRNIGGPYIPLAAVPSGGARLDLVNSPLTKYGVLAYMA